MKYNEKTVVKFIANLKDISLSQYFAQDVFQEFMKLVAEGKEIAAAEQYQNVTGSSIEDCRLAVSLAKQL